MCVCRILIKITYLLTYLLTYLQTEQNVGLFTREVGVLLLHLRKPRKCCSGVANACRVKFTYLVAVSWKFSVISVYTT